MLVPGILLLQTASTAVDSVDSCKLVVLRPVYDDKAVDCCSIKTAGGLGSRKLPVAPGAAAGLYSAAVDEVHPFA